MSTAPSPPTDEREVRYVWQGRQSEAILDHTRYLDIEGAIRAAKTTIGLNKVVGDCLEQPGARWLVCRWTDDAVKTTVRPLLADLLGRLGIVQKWHGEEHRYELYNGSWIYVRGLRAAEDTNRFGRFRGLTLCGIYCDQAEEVPYDIYLELKGRLSQVGYRQQLILTPNPPGEDHWLAKDFPVDNSRPDHKLITLSLYDNAHNLDPGYIESLERDYPLGHPLRRRLIEGRRGLSVVGQAVYANVFDRRRHVRDIDLIGDLPLLESWDFGHSHPAVVWAQVAPWGELRLLGEWMGTDQFIEDAVLEVLALRSQLFPDVLDVWTTCDPAGAARDSQGLNKTAVQVLQEHGIMARHTPGANQPQSRDLAIQRVAQYALRLTSLGTVGLAVHPRCKVLIDGFEAGYTWDDKSTTNTLTPNVRRPRKDGYYDHLQNCVEYLALAFCGAQPTRKQQEAAKRQAVLAAQRDLDPYDLVRRQRMAGGYGAGRGGY